MANPIKQHGDEGTPRLQITTEARSADLVDEMGEGEDRRTTFRADVLVHAFDGLLLVGDVALEDDRWAFLILKAAEWTETSYRCLPSKIQHDGNGYSVALPPADDAGFDVGDVPGVHTAPQLLVLTTDATATLGAELTDLRKDQQQYGTVDGLDN